MVRLRAAASEATAPDRARVRRAPTPETGGVARKTGRSIGSSGRSGATRHARSGRTTATTAVRTGRTTPTIITTTATMAAITTPTARPSLQAPRRARRSRPRRTGPWTASRPPSSSAVLPTTGATPPGTSASTAAETSHTPWQTHPPGTSSLRRPEPHDPEPADELFDAQLCLALVQHGVHAGMADRTDDLVGVWNQRFTHVSIAVAVAARRQLDPRGEFWQRVFESTGQGRCPEPLICAARSLSGSAAKSWDTGAKRRT